MNLLKKIDFRYSPSLHALQNISQRPMHCQTVKHWHIPSTSTLSGFTTFKYNLTVMSFQLREYFWHFYSIKNLIYDIKYFGMKRKWKRTKEFPYFQDPIYWKLCFSNLCKRSPCMRGRHSFTADSNILKNVSWAKQSTSF